MSDCGDVKKVFIAAKESAKPIAPLKGVDISEDAAEKIKQFLEQENKAPSEYGLLIGIRKDGCSGLSYDMRLSDLKTSQEVGDKCFEKNGAHVMIEKSSYFYVIGSRLDYVEALTGSGFQLINPNIKISCACGSSFNV